MYFKACNAISGITKWPAKHYSLWHSEKSRNLDTVDTLLRLEFLTTRAVTIWKIQKKKHLMHLSLLFFNFREGRRQSRKAGCQWKWAWKSFTFAILLGIEGAKASAGRYRIDYPIQFCFWGTKWKFKFLIWIQCKVVKWDFFVIFKYSDFRSVFF